MYGSGGQLRVRLPGASGIRLVEGTIKEIQLDALGRLPERLPIPKNEVQDVRVWLANQALQTMTLVDTPGFSSGQAEVNAKEDDVFDRRTAPSGGELRRRRICAEPDFACRRRGRPALLPGSSARSVIGRQRGGCVDEGGQASRADPPTPWTRHRRLPNGTPSDTLATSLRLYRWSDSGPRLRSLARSTSRTWPD